MQHDSKFLVVIKTIDTVTDALGTTFPNTTTYPALGNHDYWPANDLPNHTNPVYNATSQLWAPWLRGRALYNLSYLSNYGYYKVSLARNVVLIVLNTNLYYQFNKASANFGSDPGNQFQWLQAQLELARASKTKAMP